MKFKAAIFDLDGTLACTLPDLHACVNHLMEERGYPLRTVEDILRYVNGAEYGFIKSLLPEDVQEDKETVDACVNRYSAYYGEHYCDGTHLYEGLTDVLDILKENGVWLAVHTNKKHEHAVGMVKKLVKDGIFDALVGEGIYKAKPDPEGALILAERAGVKPEEVCFIGDSNVDMDTAKNAGMFALGVTWGYRPAEVLLAHGADALADTAGDILKIFGLA
ncbi:MAG: HAD-IA family hydrolase [Clostridia bacterium]|nr:HAD-IA family hydrolase [Clostridia bacterium]